VTLRINQRVCGERGESPVVSHFTSSVEQEREWLLPGALLKVLHGFWNAAAVVGWGIPFSCIAMI
jgi:hypothetical protein